MCVCLCYKPRKRHLPLPKNAKFRGSETQLHSFVLWRFGSSPALCVRAAFTSSAGGTGHDESMPPKRGNFLMRGQFTIHVSVRSDDCPYCPWLDVERLRRQVEEEMGRDEEAGCGPRQRPKWKLGILLRQVNTSQTRRESEERGVAKRKRLQVACALVLQTSLTQNADKICCQSFGVYGLLWAQESSQPWLSAMHKRSPTSFIEDEKRDHRLCLFSDSTWHFFEHFFRIAHMSQRMPSKNLQVQWLKSFVASAIMANLDSPRTVRLEDLEGEISAMELSAEEKQAILEDEKRAVGKRSHAEWDSLHNLGDQTPLVSKRMTPVTQISRSQGHAALRRPERSERPRGEPDVPWEAGYSPAAAPISLLPAPSAAHQMPVPGGDLPSVLLLEGFRTPNLNQAFHFNNQILVCGHPTYWNRDRSYFSYFHRQELLAAMSCDVM
eukprot:symbB.v1.2.039142.t1/scaffold6369.1/size18677/2